MEDNLHLIKWDLRTILDDLVDGRINKGHALEMIMKILITEINKERYESQKEKCISCHGTGTYVGGMYSTKCRDCAGTGFRQ